MTDSASKTTIIRVEVVFDCLMIHRGSWVVKKGEVCEECAAACTAKYLRHTFRRRLATRGVMGASNGCTTKNRCDDEDGDDFVDLIK